MRALLFIFTLVISQGSLARIVDFDSFQLEGDEASLYAWGKNFSGVPGPIINEDNLPAYVASAYDCNQVKVVVNGLSLYRKMLIDKKSTSAQVHDFSMRLQTTVQNLSLAQPQCAQAIKATYAIGSIYILAQGWNVQVDSKDANLQETPVSATWVFATAAAIDSGIMKFDGVASDHRARILGTYECGPSAIVIDTDQPPLNLGATLIHEFSHFFFDKYSVFNGLGEYRSDNFRLLLLLEEAIASVHAGFLQRSFARKVLAPQLDPDVMGDLTFFAPAGPIAQISNKISDRPNFYAIYPAEDFIRAAFFASSDWVDENGQSLFKGGVKALAQYRIDLLNRISKSYFGKDLTSKDIDDLSPEKLKGLFTTVDVGGGWAYDISVEMYFTPYTKIIWPLRWGPSNLLTPPKPKAMGYYILHTLMGKLAVDFTSAIQMGLAITNPKAKAKQRLCRDFEAAAQGPGLQDYIGQFNKPGSEGVRPGSEGVRPGSEGVRPGSEGVRPTALVRACVSIGDKL